MLSCEFYTDCADLGGSESVPCKLRTRIKITYLIELGNLLAATNFSELRNDVGMAHFNRCDIFKLGYYIDRTDGYVDI